MATICLKVATVTPTEPQLESGHCYIVFSNEVITVAALISEKVRAEFRKARASGPESSSLGLLIATPTTDETDAVKHAMTAFIRGDYLLLVDGKPMVDLDETISLTRRTGIQFMALELDAA